MDTLLERQIRDVLEAVCPTSLAPIESALRAAALALRRAGDQGIIKSTSVVGTLDGWDEAAFRMLVRDLADEFQLVASVDITGGAYTVRFAEATDQDG